MKFDAIIFHTTRLPELRAFYEGQLHFPLGTYTKDGQVHPDHSDSNVNYHLAGGLLCFEADKERTELGTVVLKVPSFKEFRARLEAAGIPILAGNEYWLKIKDPEGRSLIFEPV